MHQVSGVPKVWALQGPQEQEQQQQQQQHVIAVTMLCLCPAAAGAASRHSDCEDPPAPSPHTVAALADHICLVLLCAVPALQCWQLSSGRAPCFGGEGHA